MKQRAEVTTFYTVRHEVARVFIRDDLVFCHRYPTGPCVGGNPGVRSARDTVASVLSTGNGTARGRCDCQPHGGRELGLEDMVKVTEALLSRRESNHAKEADRHEPKGMQSGWGVRVSPHADVALPAERRGLSPSRMVRVRNVVSPTIPTRIVEGGPQGLTGGRVGMGCRRKRMPAAERQRETITGWIGPMASPTGR